MDNVLASVVQPSSFPQPWRGIRAELMSRMWGAGMPCNDTRFVDIIIAAKKAGLDGDQAWALGCAAYHAQKGYTENLDRCLGWLRRNTLMRKAQDSGPFSLWRWLQEKHKGAYMYLTEEQIRHEHNANYAEWSAWSDAKHAVEDASIAAMDQRDAEMRARGNGAQL